MVTFDINDGNIDYTQKIKDAIDVKLIDTDLYMSKELWLPAGTRGAFGGQVIAQSLNAAYDTVTDDFVIHSLHAYFIMACKTDIPIIYKVQRVRDGKTFATRLIKGIQKEKVVFMCSYSFTKPEEGVTLEHQDEMPNVPDPETLLPDVVMLKKSIEDTPHVSHESKQRARERLQNLQPIDYRAVNGHTLEEFVTGKVPPSRTLRRWFKSRGALENNMRLHTCVIAYASDNELISAAGAACGNMSRSENIGMMASLDHTIWFHLPTVTRADEWLLYDTYSPRSSGGRGVSFGKIFDRQGNLIATTAQEGLIRLSTPVQEKFQNADKELHKELLRKLYFNKL